MDFKNPFTSKRERTVERDVTEPTFFEMFGGFAPIEEGRYKPDPVEAELTARQAGVEVANQLETQRLERLKAHREAELANVPRGLSQDPRWVPPGDRR